MPKEFILAVDDEEDILQLVRYNLAKEGYRVECVKSGEEALRQARAGHPNLILLDLMLPGLDGLEVCKRLKGDPDTAMTPVIMLTAKGEDADIVAGLELGADDYIVKPFSPRVLVARVRTVLRRESRQVTDGQTPLRIYEIEINPNRHEVQVDGEVIPLTVTECLHSRFSGQASRLGVHPQPDH